jgi:ubiquinone/menaquinone biosynthesis C-methylase UbiE
MNDERKDVQPPEGVIDRAGVLMNDVVADLGCGNGYLSLPLLKRCREVIAIDAQMGMLTDLKENADKADRDRLRMILAELPNIPLKDDAVDRVILVNMLHELEDKDLMGKECHRVLRKGGTATVVDFQKRSTSFGPPVEMRIEEEDVPRYFDRLSIKGRYGTEIFYQFEFLKE